MKLRLVVAILGLVCVSGCASVYDAAAPSAFAVEDDRGAKWMVRQLPVSSSSSLSENWHGLGFTWFVTDPKVVSLEPVIFSAGGFTGGFISEVSFDADGQVISALKQLDEKGVIKSFQISMDDLVRIANAKKVEMKVTRFGKQTISTFGKAFLGTRAVVNERLSPFLKMTQEVQRDWKGR